MGLSPTKSERLARARSDLRIGLPVILRNDNRRWAVLAAETADPTRFAALSDISGVVMAVSAWRAHTLKVPAYDGEIARIMLPRDASLGWVRAVADPATDLANPMLGPFATVREGEAEAHRLAVRLTKSARLLPAVLVAEIPDLPVGLSEIEIHGLDASLGDLNPLQEIVSARVPLAHGSSRVHVFRGADGGEEHYAVELGRPDRAAPVLVRLHSACFTGDILGSLKCDCGPQLHAALCGMAAEGAGILMYLNQEGRGIGLANKMRAYSLQDQGFDTVEANHRLGFEDDERDFRIGAALLRQLGIRRVRLMTNNPAKVAMMEASGIEVSERVPLVAGRTAQNAAYLDVKAKKSGHLL